MFVNVVRGICFQGRVYCACAQTQRHETDDDPAIASRCTKDSTCDAENP